MRYRLAIGVLAALTAPAGAMDTPPGYVRAVFTGHGPEGTYSRAGWARKKDCGKSISVLVEGVDGQPASADARISCGR